MKKKPAARPVLPPLTPEDFDIPPQESYTLAEFARFFGVSERTVARIVAEGGLLATGRGPHDTITREELLAYFERQQRREGNP